MGAIFLLVRRCSLTAPARSGARKLTVLCWHLIISGEDYAYAQHALARRPQARQARVTGRCAGGLGDRPGLGRVGGSSRVSAAIRARSVQLHLRPTGAPLEHCELMTEDHDLELLAGVGSGSEHLPAQQPAEHLVAQPQRHPGGSCRASVSGEARTLSARHKPWCSSSGHLLHRFVGGDDGYDPWPPFG